MNKDCIDLGNLIKGMVLVAEKDFQKKYIYLLNQYTKLQKEQHTNPRSIWLTEVEKEVNENKSEKNMAAWKFILLITDFPMEPFIRNILQKPNFDWLKDTDIIEFRHKFMTDLINNKSFTPKDTNIIINQLGWFLGAIYNKYQRMKKALCPEITAGNKYDEGEYQLKF